MLSKRSRLVASTTLGSAILALSLGGMGMAFLEHYQDLMAIFVRSGHG